MGSSKAVALCLMFAVLLAVGLGCRALGFRSAEPKLTYEVARGLEEDGKYAAAIEKYKASIAENPASKLNPYAAFRIAKCYEKLGEKDKALAQYDEVMKTYPGKEPAEWAKVDKEYLEKHPDKVLPRPKAKPVEKKTEPAKPKEEPKKPAEAPKAPTPAPAK